MSCGVLHVGDKVRVTAGPRRCEVGVVSEIPGGQALVQLASVPLGTVWTVVRWYIWIDTVALQILDSGTTIAEGSA